MLPVTHGEDYTRLHILFYTVLLAATTALPLATGMSGLFYGARRAVAQRHLSWPIAWRLYHWDGGAPLARQTFAWSIRYLGLLFAALLLDHWLSVAPAVFDPGRRKAAHRPGPA
jgi:heme o synthase